MEQLGNGKEGDGGQERERNANNTVLLRWMHILILDLRSKRWYDWPTNARRTRGGRHGVIVWTKPRPVPFNTL